MSLIPNWLIFNWLIFIHCRFLLTGLYTDVNDFISLHFGSAAIINTTIWAPRAGCFYYLASTINPILYNVMSARYREAFLQTLCSLPGGVGGGGGGNNGHWTHGAGGGGSGSGRYATTSSNRNHLHLSSRWIINLINLIICYIVIAVVVTLLSHDTIYQVVGGCGLTLSLLLLTFNRINRQNGAQRVRCTVRGREGINILFGLVRSIAHQTNNNKLQWLNNF